MSISFEGRVAIVTGAGNGLGRAHALELAARGAKVVINDFGGARDGTGASSEAADKVVAEIVAKGGEAMAAPCSVTDEKGVADMVKAALEKWSRIDILINNAGILRDKTFSKMEIEDFRLVLDVHLMGSVICTRAVWDVMRAQNYGRIVLTASASGIYGNFGQANYGAAKMAMVGLMNVLCLEGAKNDIRVNTLAPTAATRMTEELLPKPALELMRPELITPGVLYLVSQDAPTRCILGAGAGAFARTMIYETDGVYIDAPTVEKVAEHFAEISDTSKQEALQNAFQQTSKYITKAAAAKGVSLKG
jgi:NAD(P)-dependent dehydrogenase (short-subunit alcohol dehydrogenase family)